MPIVKVPDGRLIKFPDGMSRDDMAGALKSLPKIGQSTINNPNTPRLTSQDQTELDELLGMTPEIVESGKNFVRGAVTMPLQTLGEIGGGLIGAGVAGPVGGGVGAITGGSGGYAGGNWLVDKMLGEQKSDLKSDAMLGAGTSALGQVAGPVLNKALDYVPAPLMQAGKKLFDATKGKLGAFDSKIDDLLIPGYKPVVGQSGEGGTLVELARRAFGSADDEMMQLYEKRMAENNAVMKDYLKRELPGGDVDDLIKTANETREKIAKGIEIPQEELGRLADSMAMLKNPDAYGAEVRDLLREAKDISHSKVKKIWDDLPNYEIGVNSVKRGIADLRKELTESAMVEDLPSELMKMIDNTPTSKRVPLSQIRKWISTAGKKAYAATPGSTEQLAAKKLQRKLEDTLDNQLGGMPDYNAARKAWKGYKDKFFDGPVGNALNPKKGLTDLKAMMGMFDPKNPELSEGIIKAMGKEKGEETIKNIALADLRDKAYLKGTGVVDPKKATLWMDQNRNLLERYGLTEEFSNYEKLGKKILEAEKNNADFQKTILAKVAETNPKEIISGLLSGSDSGAKTRALMTQLRDPAAKEGLRGALKDHIMRNAENKFGSLESTKIKDMVGETGRDMMGKYDPVIKELFSSPDDLGSMHLVRQLLDYAEKVKPQGGFPTSNLMEKMSYSQEAGPVAAVGPASILSKWFDKIGKKKLVQAMLDPAEAKNIMSDFMGIKQLLAGAPEVSASKGLTQIPGVFRTGATYTPAAGGLMDLINRR